jgi:hypothetical protein
VTQLDVFPCCAMRVEVGRSRFPDEAGLRGYPCALGLRVAVAGTHRADTNAPAEVLSFTLPVTTLG